ncbi:hypothetical protein BV20DRAFT_1002228 [Pilatotrama ljubarskyi]|nr:hypothetical protein BV20DRAFT_1002228 [Pilatotrama ljubarskyi]
MWTKNSAAAKFKEQGNDLFKGGEFARAAELYAKAERFDPNDPVYPSNLSAALYEAGDYRDCVAAVSRAWKLLKEQPDAKPDLSSRLSSRLAKALCLLVQSQPSSREAFKEYEATIQELQDHALSSSPDGELAKAWKDWQAMNVDPEHRARKCDAALSSLSRLPLFMKPLDDAREFYTIGHDPIIDLTAGWGSSEGGDPLRIDKMPTEKLSEVSFLFGGVGDGRHALGTIQGLYQAYKKLPAAEQSAFHTHLTLLDIHPSAIARDLCMLMLLHQLSETTDSTTRAEIKATLLYSFCAAIMPDYCYERLMAVIQDIGERLSQSPPTLPPWLHVDADTIPAVIPALAFWRTVQKSTRRMLAHNAHFNPDNSWSSQAMAFAEGASGESEIQRELRDRFKEQRSSIERMFRGLTDDQVRQLPFMPSGITTREARAFLDANMDDLVNMMHETSVTGRVRMDEQEWYKVTKTFLPPTELRRRHPGFQEAWSKLSKGDDISRNAAAKLRSQVENEWKTNITLMDSNYNNPKYHPDGDGYKTMTGDPFETVGFVEEFNKTNKPASKGPVKNDAGTLTWDVFNEFFENISAALRGLSGHITVELICGGLSEELAKMRFKGDVTRPANFPRKYLRMWLSNVPDYTHGPMNVAIYVVPNLQDDSQAGAACNCLLNTGSWSNDDHYFYTYSHLLSKDMPRFLGCRVIHSKAVMDVLVLGPLALPRPRTELATRDELTTWLMRVLFNTLIPGRTRMPPETVRLPNNLVAFFGLLMHLHRVGFPPHWLSDFLGRVLSGSMVSDIAPYDGLWPIPLEDMRRRVPSRRVRTDAWLVEFENIIATAYDGIPFPIASLLPADFTRDREDIRVWEAKVTATIPFTATYSPFMGYGSPYEPVTRLLFYRPAETSPHTLISSMRAIFEGRSSPAPGTFFVLTAQELVQYDRRIRFRLSKQRVERLKREKWSMVAYRQDTGQQFIRPAPATDWTLVDEEE